MKSVWRYELAMEDEQVIKMPCAAEPLHVTWRHNGIELWTLVDTDEKTITGRQVKIRGTGHKLDFDLNQFQYVGTVIEDITGTIGFVWHVWVEK